MAIKRLMSIALFGIVFIRPAISGELSCQDTASSALQLIQKRVDALWEQLSPLINSPIGRAVEMQNGYSTPRTARIIGTVTLAEDRYSVRCRLIYSAHDVAGNLIGETQAVYMASALDGASGRYWIQFEEDEGQKSRRR